MNDEVDVAIEKYIDDISSIEKFQSNSMFQLALIVTRIATESVSEAYRDEASQSLLNLIRKKPKSSAAHLFGNTLSAGERRILDR